MDSSFPARLDDRDRLVGVWSVIGHPVVADLLGAAGFDFVVLDGEHSENTVEEIGVSIRAIEATGTDAAPVVRAPENNPADIRRLLDLGPEGIIVPQIESLAEARDAVEATQYPPAGIRGVAGNRASGYGRRLGEYVERADDQVATILQIETETALDAVEEIAAIDGLDGLFIGLADLSARLGIFGQFESEQFLDAIERTVAAAAAAEVPVGTLATTLPSIERRDDWGVDFMATGTDVGCLRHAAEQYLTRYREL